MLLKDKFLSKKINDLFWKEKLTLATAESCTGGSISVAITSVPGSSQFFKGGIVAYSNEVKESILGVSKETLMNYGAVSEQTVIEMAQGAMRIMNCDCAVATSGIAGPTGGSNDKPIGMVWIAVICKDEIKTVKINGDNGREINITTATDRALELLFEMCQSKENEE